MVRKIETEQRKHLDPSTVRDLLSIKLNNYTPCFENEHLMSKDMLNQPPGAVFQRKKQQQLVPVSQKIRICTDIQLLFHSNFSYHCITIWSFLNS